VTIPENDRLRQRLTRQRRELRRLNAKLLMRSNTSWASANTIEQVADWKHETAKQIKRQHELSRLLARWCAAHPDDALASLTGKVLARQMAVADGRVGPVLDAIGRLSLPEDR